MLLLLVSHWSRAVTLMAGVLSGLFHQEAAVRAPDGLVATTRSRSGYEVDDARCFSRAVVQKIVGYHGYSIVHACAMWLLLQASKAESPREAGVSARVLEHDESLRCCLACCRVTSSSMGQAISPAAPCTQPHVYSVLG